MTNPMPATGQAGMTSQDPPEEHQTAKILTMAARFVGYFVYVYIIFVEIILLLGFFLLLFGANTSAGFVEWAYRNLDRAMKPFRGIFTPIELGTTNGNEVVSVFDTSVLFAMIIYGIIGIAVHAFIGWLTARLRRMEREESAERFQYESRLQHENQLLRDQVMRAAQAPSDPTPVNMPPPPSGPDPV